MRIVPAFLRSGALSLDRLPAEPRVVERWASGVASLDEALGGGLAYGQVHEIYAAELADAPAAMGFALAAATAMGITATGEGAATASTRSLLWLRSRRCAGQGGVLQANGWAELGGTPDTGLVAIVADAAALLRTAVDALRCPALGAVIVEGWGAMRELDLTASRRLALAAERSGVTLFVLRIDAAPVPSAARTRWEVAAAPSCALPGKAPGRPVFDITLLRQRGGPCGQGWRLEWNRDQRTFISAAIAGTGAALPGTVVSVPARRSPAEGGAGLRAPAGERHAA